MPLALRSTRLSPPHGPAIKVRHLVISVGCAAQFALRRPATAPRFAVALDRAPRRRPARVDVRVTVAVLPPAVWACLGASHLVPLMTLALLGAGPAPGASVSVIPLTCAVRIAGRPWWCGRSDWHSRRRSWWAQQPRSPLAKWSPRSFFPARSGLQTRGDPGHNWGGLIGSAATRQVVWPSYRRGSSFSAASASGLCLVPRAVPSWRPREPGLPGSRGPRALCAEGFSSDWRLRAKQGRLGAGETTKLFKRVNCRHTETRGAASCQGRGLQRRASDTWPRNSRPASCTGSKVRALSGCP